MSVFSLETVNFCIFVSKQVAAIAHNMGWPGQRKWLLTVSADSVPLDVASMREVVTPYGNVTLELVIGESRRFEIRATEQQNV